MVVATYLADGSESNPLGLDVKNGLTYYGSAKVKSPGATNGLLMNLSRLGATAATNHGDPFDPYGTAWRTTLLEAAGTGTHTQWTGGQADWRARSAMPGAGGAAPWVTTNVSGNKISYLMESMVSRGITGSIGAVMVGVRMGAVSANTRAFIRRNGVETALTNVTLLTGDFRWYRVAASGWAATDTVEIGVTAGDNSTNSLTSLALLVEHDTPEPAPLTETAARVVTVNYTGNGGAQTIDFGGIDLVPTVLYVLSLDSPTSVEPLAWWDSRLGAAGLSQVMTNYGRVWPQRGKFHVVHSTSTDSYNANGLNYVAIALFDPAGRYAIPFAVSTPAGEDNYTHELRDPRSGEPASAFTPDFVFGGVASRQAGSATAGASVYRGPGHTGDLTSKLGVSGSQSTAEPDRIQALGAGTVQFGTLVGGHNNGDQSFWAGRVADGTSTTRLMAVTSYVGNGTTSRNIALNLSGEAPVFTIVVPMNSSAKVYRVAGDTTGRATFSGNATANSITSMTADQITVGTALNATGVTYDVWAITVGFVPPLQ